MFYSKDYANGILEYSAFESKIARDEFVESGNRRFNATPAEVKKFCRDWFDMKPRKAFEGGTL